jgi:tetratricopeptide (TPR) repeat protein
MKKSLLSLFPALIFLFTFCKQKSSNISKDAINEINLKRGEIISCGPTDQQFGTASFEVTCDEKNRKDFNLAVELLHSFEYDEAEKAFTKVIDQDPNCAMAYWGIAMSNFHPLWTPPTVDELNKGLKAIQIAKSIESSKRESAYIDAIASFYQDWEKTSHQTRCLEFEKGMEKVYKDYPDDKEAAIFYTLALNAAADPSDKSFAKQKKAGAILNALYPGQPGHPGIIHYLIHTYDYPELAQQALEAARKYATVAPSSAHALHMPSHIFTRLGLWYECIQSNIASVSSAKCYAEAAGIKGHWDEELHGLDYLMYAYLQKGENDSAKKLLDYLNTIVEVHPVNFKVAYTYAAIPSRYLLENKMWKEAGSMRVSPANVEWKNFPWQEAMFHFTHLLGSVHMGNLTAAEEELRILNRIHDTLINQKDQYKANQVAIQIKSSEAWMRLAERKSNEASTLMQLAADMEDKTEKHPVTPGEVIPARELLGDMLMKMNKPGEALKAYKANLEKHPNRLNSLTGAIAAARGTGDSETATVYFQQLMSVVGKTKAGKIEMKNVKY